MGIFDSFSNNEIKKIKKNNSEYIGQVKDNTIPHGYGKITYYDVGIYVGEFKNGKPHGQGIYTFSNGDKYVGEVKNGKPHGQGIYTFSTGDKYVGEFKNWERHGQGVYTYLNGEKLVGEYKNDNFYGLQLEIFKFPELPPAIGVNFLLEDVRLWNIVINSDPDLELGENWDDWTGWNLDNVSIDINQFRNGVQSGIGYCIDQNKTLKINEYKNDKEHGREIYIYYLGEEISIREYDNGNIKEEEVIDLYLDELKKKSKKNL